MPYSLKEHIAECYRRAEEFAQLHKRASKSQERGILWTTRQHFLLLAMALERKLQEAPRRRTKKLKSA